MIRFRLRNAAEMVFSAVPATEGGHRALSYIPGQTLWGAFAARVYADLSLRARSFDLVHSGRIRFSPGFPLAPDGTPAFPWPQCLQYPKHESPGNQGEFKIRRLWNAIEGSMKEEGQRVQTEPPKGQFISASGEIAKPARHERGKSAIEPGDRRVATAQFFQYEHLEGGTDWIFWIDADDPTDAEIAAGVLERAPLSLGRSKRREYGGEVTLERIGGDADPVGSSAGASAYTVIWCLSDVALTNVRGMPVLTPSGCELGIEGFDGTLSATRSLISTRRFAPWNMYLRSRDREVSVIEAGSVLVYDNPTSVDPAAFANGLGLWRERGLGIVSVNPALLNTAGQWPRDSRQATPKKVVAADVGEKIEVPAQYGPLLDRLRARAARRDSDKQIDTTATEIEAQLKSLIGRALQTATVPHASQWSRVADAAERAAGNLGGFEAALFDHTPMHGQSLPICVGTGKESWNSLRGPLRACIRDRFGTYDFDDIRFLTAVGIACRRIASSREFKQ